MLKQKLQHKSGFFSPSLEMKRIARCERGLKRRGMGYIESKSINENATNSSFLYCDKVAKERKKNATKLQTEMKKMEANC